MRGARSRPHSTPAFALSRRTLNDGDRPAAEGLGDPADDIEPAGSTFSPEPLSPSASPDTASAEVAFRAADKDEGLPRDFVAGWGRPSTMQLARPAPEGRSEQGISVARAAVSVPASAVVATSQRPHSPMGRPRGHRHGPPVRRRLQVGHAVAPRRGRWLQPSHGATCEGLCASPSGLPLGYMRR